MMLGDLNNPVAVATCDRFARPCRPFSPPNSGPTPRHDPARRPGYASITGSLPPRLRASWPGLRALYGREWAPQPPDHSTRAPCGATGRQACGEGDPEKRERLNRNGSRSLRLIFCTQAARHDCGEVWEEESHGKQAGRQAGRLSWHFISFPAPRGGVHPSGENRAFFFLSSRPAVERATNTSPLTVQADGRKGNHEIKRSYRNRVESRRRRFSTRGSKRGRLDRLDGPLGWPGLDWPRERRALLNIQILQNRRLGAMGSECERRWCKEREPHFIDVAMIEQAGGTAECTSWPSFDIGPWSWFLMIEMGSDGQSPIAMSRALAIPMSLRTQQLVKFWSALDTLTALSMMVTAHP